MKYQPGTRIQAFGKSKHAGQTGTIIADHGQYIMLLADDPTYIHAHKNTIAEDPKSPNRYFWVDTLCLKEIKQ